MSKPAMDALSNREDEVDAALRGSIPRYQAQLEKTIIIAAKAIVEALYKARY